MPNDSARVDDVDLPTNTAMRSSSQLGNGGASCSVLVNGENFSDGTAGDAGEDGVGVLVVREGDQPDR